MTESAEFLDLIRAAFPAEPVPAQFFWREGKDSLDLDIPQELRNRISGRPWIEVTLMDWRMTGTSPVVARRYLEPATFMYYVPSIIVGASQDIGFVDFALEGIIPHNKYHVPRDNGGPSSQELLRWISGRHCLRFSHTSGLRLGTRSDLLANIFWSMRRACGPTER